MDSTIKKEKERNPIEKANIISLLTFTYMLPIFKTNFKNGLKEENLFEPLDEHKSDFLGEQLEQKWLEEHRKHKSSSLHRALFKIYGFKFLALGFLRLINEVLLVVVMPLSIGRLVSYFDKDQTDISRNEAYIVGCIIIGCRFVDTIMAHTSMMGLMHSTMKMRIACGALIYRKMLKLNKSALGGTTIGQIVNLLSNDVSKFDQAFVLANFAYIAPIQAAVGTYFLYREIGVSAFFGMALLLSIIPLQTWFGKKCSILRLRTALRTDERVRLMSEIISGIQVIKMYCWEKPFGNLVINSRKKEMNAIKARGYLMGLVYCLEMFITRASVFVSILAYVLLGEYITAEKVFAVTAIYAVIRPVITTIFSFSISSLAEVNVSVNRLQKFLVIDEQEESLEIIETTPLINPSKLVLEKVSATWLKESKENTTTTTLKEINLEIASEQLVAIIGPVGSGKSSLLNVFLKELPLDSGRMEVEGTLSYSSQEPWLFSASVRQNILFGTEFDENRYQKVVEVCALVSDFETLPFGDKTLVGERGATLSGGQKARINLARCIYKQADIYLLDDPLSAVDANVGKHLYEKCIKSFLHDKICVLITHQLQYLSSADRIIVMDEGQIVLQGNYEELQTSGLDFAKLLEQFHVDEEEEHNKKKKIKSIENLADEKDLDDDEEEEQLVEVEQMKSGSINFSLYWAYFKSGGGVFNAILMFSVFIGAQVVASSADYYTTYWVNIEEDFMAQNLSNNYETIQVRNNIIYTYSGIILAAIIFGIGHGIYFMLFFVLASSTLHQSSFSNMIRAKMQFFNANPSGRILNRFSKDLGNIDENIPGILYDVVAVGLDLFGAIVLSAKVDAWLLLPSAVLVVIFYLFRVVYLETSRNVKRIEGITKSPIYTHMTASMHGLSTIRAFNAQKVLTKEFDEHQDKHSSAWFIYLTSNRCFGCWIDLICVVFVASAIFIMLYFKQNFYGGEIGLVLTQYIGLTGAMQWGIRQWSELENQMVSIERILEYSKVETEPIRKENATISKDWPRDGKMQFETASLKYKDTDPAPIRKENATISKDWPRDGKIQFENVSLKYKETDPAPVLKNLNFTVYPKEKIGIVGRTGAGKTSIITALFQLYEIEGSIIVDDVDTTKLPLQEIRTKISIIPQEPVLFSGTMRKNLDPFEEYDDQTLWNALEQVELKELISELPAGLHSNVSEGGANFSVGQRQLVCLARALIRHNKILVMDEATANVDPYTDALIQTTLREKFGECTVLTIAHRLHTVMDSDKILVMDAGRVQEFDHPHKLLQNQDSWFYNLVQKTGRATAANLERVALESYRKMEKNAKDIK